MFNSINTTTVRMRALNSREIRRARRKKNKDNQEFTVFKHKISHIMKNNFNEINLIKQVQQ